MKLRQLMCVTLTGLPLAICTASIDSGATTSGATKGADRSGASVPIWQQAPTTYSGGGGGGGGEGGSGGM